MQVTIKGTNDAAVLSSATIELSETVRYIAENWPRLVSALPNAGLPIMVDGKSHFPMNPADFTKGMLRYVDSFGVNVVGGFEISANEMLPS